MCPRISRAQLSTTRYNDKKTWGWVGRRLVPKSGDFQGICAWLCLFATVDRVACRKSPKELKKSPALSLSGSPRR